MGLATSFLVKKPMRERYVGKIDTIALLLLGNVKPENLKAWYPDITDSDIVKARKKIERLELRR